MAERSQAPSDFVITMGGISNAVSNGHCIVSTAHSEYGTDLDIPHSP